MLMIHNIVDMSIAHLVKILFISLEIENLNHPLFVKLKRVVNSYIPLNQRFQFLLHICNVNNKIIKKDIIIKECK